jgi:four helix bundle protein
MQNSNNKKYDLDERTAKFGEDVIDFLKELKKDEINKPMTSQTIRCCTSIGANYMEADGAESGKDFKHKIAICKKESKESMYWIRMIARNNSEKREECRRLWQEAHELALIFSSILLPKNKK